MKKEDLFYGPIMKEAWAKAKLNYGSIILFGLVYVIILGGLGTFSNNDQGAFMKILSVIASIMLSFWSRKLVIWVGSGGDVKLMKVFSNLQNFGKFFITKIVYGFIVLGGLILLIVPGLIWAYKYILAPYFAVDGLSMKDSLKASSQATKGVKLKIFFLGLILAIIILGLAVVPFLLNFIAPALLPIFIGLSGIVAVFVILPWYMAIYGVLYTKLRDATMLKTQETVTSPMPNVQPGSQMNTQPSMPEHDEVVAQPTEIPQHPNTTQM